MIAIQFQKRDFEYDVYNLVKSFYPEEEIVLSDDDSPAAEYDEKISLFYGKNKISIRIERVSGDRKRQEEGVWLTEEMHGRKERKNQTKILLYHMLQKRTGQELPWGTLTGVRPTKIPMALIDAGHSNVETAKIMREQYLVSREKTALAVSIANRERHILEDIDYKNGYSLYIGIPFCPTICAYCSFSSSPLKVWKNKVDDYLNALCHEIRETASMWAGQVLDTIYIGGGTPTTLEPHQLERLLSEVEKCFDISHIKEYTVEAGRPDSITWEKLAVIRKHPVTRISINPQSMQQKTLDVIGRKHTVEEIKEAYALARKTGFDNINMDIIAGLPGEDISDMEDTLAQIAQMHPDSLTVHSLAIKRAARMEMEDLNRDAKETHEILSGMIERAAKAAKEMDLFPYYLYRQKNIAGNFENVGYAKVDKAGIYNILIMEEKQSIIAAGAGASTKIVLKDPIPMLGSKKKKMTRLIRQENVKAVDAYIDRIDEMIERKGEWLWH